MTFNKYIYPLILYYFNQLPKSRLLLIFRLLLFWKGKNTFLNNLFIDITALRVILSNFTNASYLP